MTTDHQNVLSVTNLAKTYRSAGEQIEVLRGVNLSIAAVERVALTGESGRGKSILLHLIAGLDKPDSVGIWSSVIAGHCSSDDMWALRRPVRRTIGLRH